MDQQGNRELKDHQYVLLAFLISELVFRLLTKFFITLSLDSFAV